MAAHKNFMIVFIPSIYTSSAELVVEFDTLLEAATALNAIANYTLLLHKSSLIPDYSNMGIIYKRYQNKWLEIDVRIDDKLSRLQKGQEYPGDDTVKDLAGYLILRMVVHQIINNKKGNTP